LWWIKRWDRIWSGEFEVDHGRGLGWANQADHLLKLLLYVVGRLGGLPMGGWDDAGLQRKSVSGAQKKKRTGRAADGRETGSTGSGGDTGLFISGLAYLYLQTLVHSQIWAQMAHAKSDIKCENWVD
jgi:hypothetical protein